MPELKDFIGWMVAVLVAVLPFIIGYQVWVHKKVVNASQAARDSLKASTEAMKSSTEALESSKEGLRAATAALERAQDAESKLVHEGQVKTIVHREVKEIRDEVNGMRTSLEESHSKLIKLFVDHNNQVNTRLDNIIQVVAKRT